MKVTLGIFLVLLRKHIKLRSQCLFYIFKTINKVLQNFTPVTILSIMDFMDFEKVLMQ